MTSSPAAPTICATIAAAITARIIAAANATTTPAPANPVAATAAAAASASGCPTPSHTAATADATTVATATVAVAGAATVRGTSAATAVATTVAVGPPTDPGQSAVSARPASALQTLAVSAIVAVIAGCPRSIRSGGASTISARIKKVPTNGIATAAHFLTTLCTVRERQHLRCRGCPSQARVEQIGRYVSS